MDMSISDRRRQTRSSIYHYLYNAKSFRSRQQLASDLALSLPTVYQNLSELMAAGLVQNSGEKKQTGGRKAGGLSIVPDARIAIGVSITDKFLRFAAANLLMEELGYRKVDISSLENLGVKVAEELEVFLDEAKIDRKRILGVGLAIPAVIDRKNAMVILSPTLSLRNVSLDSLIKHIPYPGFVENDANCGGLSEWFFRNKHKSMAYLSLENGVGGTVLQGNGQILPGDNMRGGEFGHMCIEPGGLKCKCGKQGCLEAYCSALRISADLGISLDDFFAGVQNHVLEYEYLWQDLLRHLALGISNIRMALDCDVVLGGFLTEYIPPYLDIIKNYLSALDTFSENADYLYLSASPTRSAPLGAALHFVSEFLKSI